MKCDEDVLIDLEKRWSRIELQTNWKFEPCFRPIEKDAHSNNHQPQAAAVSSESSTSGQSLRVNTSNSTSVNNINSDDEQVLLHQDPEAGDPETNHD